MCTNKDSRESLDIFECSDEFADIFSDVGDRSVWADDKYVVGSLRRKEICKSEEHILQKCQKIYQTRRAREKIFGSSEIFSDPAWDILLYMFIARLQGRRISVESSGQAACITINLALRWLSILEKNGFVGREYDPIDRRCMNVTLTERGIENMRAILEDI